MSTELAPPPRRVALGARLRARFGGTLVQSGWALIALGMLTGSKLVGGSELVTALTFIGPRHTTTGIVTEVSETRASEQPEPLLRDHGAFAARLETRRDDILYDETIEVAFVMRSGAMLRTRDPLRCSRRASRSARASRRSRAGKRSAATR